MTRFLLKGLVRDRHRSLFPVLVVTLGVLITVILYSWMQGWSEDLIETNARLDTGHLKVMTQGYAEHAVQLPNDLALMNAAETLRDLSERYSDLEWVARIRFGGLLDLPDEQGETRSQGPVFGVALDLLSAESKELSRLQLGEALVSGRLPQKAGEILTSDQLAQRLDIHLGDTATLIGATSNGSMAVMNFTVVGTLRFGITTLDRNAMLADLRDIQYALDLEDSAGEILGYFKDELYRPNRARAIADEFNAGQEQDEWALTMLTLHDQNGLGEYLGMVDKEIVIISAIFVVVMSIVLWNAGLMSGLRRYGEMGLRLAFGESKTHVYRTLLAESALIGLAGSLLGTLIGLGFSYYLQVYGLDISSMTKESALLWSNVIRARIMPASYVVGFIPGLLATFLGSLISGTGIFKRQTSQLFKELET